MTMLTSKINFVFGLTGSIFFGILIFLLVRPSDPTFYFEQNNWALKTNENQLILESPETDKDYFFAKLWPYEFRSIPTIYLSEIEIGKSLFLSNQLKVHRLDQSLWALDIEQTRWLIFGKNFVKFPSQVPISTRSDFWIINSKAKTPDNLSAPSRSIFELSNRPTKKDLKNFSENTNVNIITTNDHEEIKIRWNKTQWVIQTISYKDENS